MKKYYMTEETRESNEYGYEYYPEEIAKMIYEMAKGNGGYEPTDKDLIDCEEALYTLLSYADNDFNRDIYRTAYKLLAKATYNFEIMEREKELTTFKSDLREMQEELLDSLV